MKIGIACRAGRRLEMIDERWRREADYPRLFAEELHRAVIELASIPDLGSP